MQNIFDIILDNIDKITAVIVALAALVTTVIVEYKRIRELINKEVLLKAAAPLIAKAETKPAELLSELKNKPPISPIEVNSNEGKQSIVTQALIEREPKLLKKMKLKDAVEIGGFVSSAYQTVKPLIKGLIK